MADSNQNQQQFVIPEEIKTYLEGLLVDAGITSLDEKGKEQMVKELYLRLDNYLMTVIVEAIPEDKIDAFLELQKQDKTKQELEQYIVDNIPDSQQVFTKAFGDFRDLYLQKVAEAKENKPDTTIN